jgi:hypothetical protein
MTHEGASMADADSSRLLRSPVLRYVTALRTQRATAVLLTPDVVAHYAVAIAVLVVASAMWRSEVNTVVGSPGGYWLVVAVLCLVSVLTTGGLAARYLTPRHYGHLRYLGFSHRDVCGLLALLVAPPALAWIAAWALLAAGLCPWWEVLVGAIALAGVIEALVPTAHADQVRRPQTARSRRPGRHRGRLMPRRPVAAWFAKDVACTGRGSLVGTVFAVVLIGLFLVWVLRPPYTGIGAYFSCMIAGFGAACFVFASEADDTADFNRAYFQLTPRAFVRLKLVPVAVLVAVQGIAGLALTVAMGWFGWLNLLWWALGCALAAAATWCLVWYVADHVDAGGRMDAVFVIVILFVALAPGLAFIDGLLARHQFKESGHVGR